MNVEWREGHKLIKLIAFGVRKDEEPYFKNWEKPNDAEITFVLELLSEENLDKINGFDGIIGLQTTPYKREYFEKMKEAGIKILSIRNIGIDNIDLEAAKENQIPITNVPAYSPSAIAEFTIDSWCCRYRTYRSGSDQINRWFGSKCDCV